MLAQSTIPLLAFPTTAKTFRALVTHQYIKFLKVSVYYNFHA